MNNSSSLSQNERLILSLLRQAGPLPKARIADMTGLSAQTASVIMRKLELEGLIKRCAPLRGKVGQPSVPMRLAERGALFFGLKVGRRSADLVLVDFLGSILERARTTYRYPRPEDACDFVEASVRELAARLPEGERDRIAGLGVALPGYLWEWGQQVGVSAAETETWRDRDFQAEVSARVEMPVFLQNDGTSACGAELHFGTAKLPPDFLYFFVGHLIGGGIVLNNELYTGPTGNAGAMGPMPIPSPRGKTRQLVDVASLHCLESDLAAAGFDPGLLWLSATDWDMDAGLLEAWLDRAGEGLAFAIAAVCSVLDFEVVVIDGWLPDTVRRDLIDRTQKALPGMNWAGLTVPELRAGTVGPDARSLGAASVPLSRMFR